MKEDITKQINALNDELASRQESIDLLKNQKIRLRALKKRLLKY